MESELSNMGENWNSFNTFYESVKTANDLINLKESADHILYIFDDQHVNDVLEHAENSPDFDTTQNGGEIDFVIVLDLDNYKYITKYKQLANNSDPVNELPDFLGDHNYCSKPLPEIHDTIKLQDFYENFKTFNDIHSDIGYNHKVCENNLKPNNVKSEIETNTNEIFIKSDNDSNVYIISDDESADIISISSDTNSDDSDSYHSSDFEFITEEEAERDGFITNYNLNNLKQNNDECTVNTIEISSESDSSFDDVDIEHTIPNNMDYINMFETNIPYPTPCMENKSIYRDSGMEVGFQELGFSINICKEDDLEENIKDEAMKSRQKILSMYPIENRRMSLRRC